MATAPYTPVSEIMDAARERCNDMIVSTGGQTLTNNAPFTLPIVNVAWQRFQQQLVSIGYVTLEDEVILPKLPPASSLDPGVQVSLSWTGFFDGITQSVSPALPQWVIRPLDLWERPSVNMGTNTQSYNDMDEIIGGGMDLADKKPWAVQWQWRADAIWMPGTISPIDLRIRAAKYLADFTNLNSDVAPIMRCKDALSGYIAVEFSGSRGDLDRTALLAEAQQATMIVAGMDTIQGRSTQKSSERGKMRDRYTPGATAA